MLKDWKNTATTRKKDRYFFVNKKKMLYINVERLGTNTWNVLFGKLTNRFTSKTYDWNRNYKYKSEAMKKAKAFMRKH